MTYIPWIVGLPLAGCVVNGLVGGRLGHRAVSAVACLSVLGAFALGVIGLRQLAGMPEQAVVKVWLFEWIPAGDLRVAAALQLDRLSALMVVVVAGVGFLIHVYSVGYMAGDPAYSRYFTYLNLFTASMLLLVLAANVLVLFVGWELVGLCSYLLIGFWFEREAAAAAGRKAFVVNRIGDAAFLLGICLLFATLGTLDFEEVGRAAQTAQADLPPERHALLTPIALLLFAGATGKSAQLPLYVWLPDAMEGPTPVSALIHAATMVTAGVYMIARLWPLFAAADWVLANVVAVIGAATALFAATVAVAQNDLKRVLAYSTISQLGYMFLALGVGAATAGMFHLTTHAFFKALLFLAAGSVMHAMHGLVDVRRLGGLARAMPLTFAGFSIGALALAGIPPLAGFWSKDHILAAAYEHGFVGLWLVGVVTALVTAFYITRATVLAFGGHPFDPRAHPHEAPPSMAWPMVVLAGLSAVGGLLGAKFVGAPFDRYLEPLFVTGIPHATPRGGLSEAALIALSVAAALAGVAAGWAVFRGRRIAEFGAVGVLLARQWMVEEAYEAVLVRPARRLARFLAEVADPVWIDGIANGIGAAASRAGAAIRTWQTGYVRQYAAGILIGALVVAGYWLLR
ncbi:MAG: NADH-quinone oxidoreductase subunit L [Armatimonadota bacterium]|nr:NADH-quinone oxidoreductase subunit L [Armatimonadota bacterium]MDR5697040.1 NADH-quinone oxidoreductase subunit L [Armatimonadota bacterium]